VNYDHLTRVSPSLEKEQFTELKALFADDTEKPTFQSHYFTEAGLVELLDKAAKLCTLATYYEYAVELLQMIVEYYQPLRAYESLQQKYKEISDLYGEISRVQSRATRLFGTYYKVGFFGKKVPENIRGKQFVYKMPKITRLAELVDYMKEIFKGLDDTQLKIVGDSFQVDKISDADSENCAYLQITSVKAFYRDERLGYFEQNANICEFSFETPFTKSGKPQSNDLADQYKRKTIIKVQVAFPCLKTRQEIIAKEEKIITPIENAMEIIDTSFARLESEISKDLPNINNLQMTLSGTIIPQVNEGIPSITRTFLAEGADEKFGKPNVDKLKNKLKEFLHYAFKGIIISNKMASKEQKPLQAQFVKGFDVLENLFKQYIHDLPDFNKEELVVETPRTPVY